MLQNEAQAESSSPLPGQRRITPEELSRAVAEIERRKQEEAQRLAGTIPIEEAVSSLHLDATPEEVWAQVQAQREAEAARQAAAAQAAAEAARREQVPQAQFGPPHAQVQTAAPRGRRPWRRIVAVGVVLWIAHTMGFGPHFGHSAAPSPPALTATEAQVPDGRQFYCDSAGLVQISEGKAPTQVHVSATEQFQNSWSLVKMNGHVYLRAFTLPLDSVQAAKGKPLVLFNDDNSGGLEGNTTAQTTVRVDKVPLQVSNGDQGYAEITIFNFQPDAFTTTSPWH